MRVTNTKNGVTLSNVPVDKIQVVMDVIETVNNRCFKNQDVEDLIDGKIPSGDDFLMLLTPEELKYLREFITEFWIELKI